MEQLFGAARLKMAMSLKYCDSLLLLLMLILTDFILASISGMESWVKSKLEEKASTPFFLL